MSKTIKSDGGQDILDRAEFDFLNDSTPEETVTSDGPEQKVAPEPAKLTPEVIKELQRRMMSKKGLDIPAAMAEFGLDILDPDTIMAYTFEEDA